MFLLHMYWFTIIKIMLVKRVFGLMCTNYVVNYCHQQSLTWKGTGPMLPTSHKCHVWMFLFIPNIYDLKLLYARCSILIGHQPFAI